MAHTYNLTTNVGKIRLLISDTDISPTTDAQFSDEELTMFHDDLASQLYSGIAAIYEAAALALDSWAASLASGGASSGGITEEKIGDYSYKIGGGGSGGGLSGQKKALAAEYHKKAAEFPVEDWAEWDLENYGDPELSEDHVRWWA